MKFIFAYTCFCILLASVSVGNEPKSPLFSPGIEIATDIAGTLLVKVASVGGSTHPRTYNFKFFKAVPDGSAFLQYGSDLSLPVLNPRVCISSDASIVCIVSTFFEDIFPNNPVVYIYKNDGKEYQKISTYLFSDLDKFSDGNDFKWIPDLNGCRLWNVGNLEIEGKYGNLVINKHAKDLELQKMGLPLACRWPIIKVPLRKSRGAGGRE